MTWKSEKNPVEHSVADRCGLCTLTPSRPGTACAVNGSAFASRGLARRDRAAPGPFAKSPWIASAHSGFPPPTLEGCSELMKEPRCFKVKEKRLLSTSHSLSSLASAMGLWVSSSPWVPCAGVSTAEQPLRWLISCVNLTRTRDAQGAGEASRLGVSGRGVSRQKRPAHGVSTQSREARPHRRGWLHPPSGG